VPSTDPTHTEEQITEEKPPELKHANEHEPHAQSVASKNLDNAENDMNKLLELMKNVVKQPGFEFLTGNTKPISKETFMAQDVNTADKRERWLYDTMMENWREKQQLDEKGEFKSVEELAGKLPDHIFSVKAGKVSGSQGGCGSGLTNEGTQKTSGDFLNIVMQHDDSEILIVGNVADGTVPDEHSSHKYGGENGEYGESRIQHELEKMKNTAVKEKMVSSDGFVHLKHADSSVEQVERSRGGSEDELDGNTETVPSSETAEYEKDELGQSTVNTESTRGDLCAEEGGGSHVRDALKHRGESVNVAPGDGPTNDNIEVGTVVDFTDCTVNEIRGDGSGTRDTGAIKHSAESGSHDARIDPAKGDTTQYKDDADTRDSDEHDKMDQSQTISVNEDRDSGMEERTSNEEHNP
jgi:hypothetical protein